MLSHKGSGATSSEIRPLPGMWGASSVTRTLDFEPAKLCVLCQPVDAGRTATKQRLSRSPRRALSCLVCYLFSLAGHLEQHGRELACLVGAQAVPTTSNVGRVQGAPLCVDLLFLIEPNMHLDRAALFVAALGRHDDLWPLVPEVNRVLRMVVEVSTACDAPRRARLVITPTVVLRESHDRTVLNVVASSSNSSHMADHGTESDPSTAFFTKSRCKHGQTLTNGTNVTGGGCRPISHAHTVPG